MQRRIALRPRWRSSWSLLDLGLSTAALLCVALIASVQPLLAAGLLLGVAVLIGTLIDPVVGLYVTVGTVLLQELVPLPLGLTVTHIVGAITLGAWLLHGCAERHIHITRDLLVPWGLFLGALILSAGLTEYNAVDALKQTVRWLLAFMAYVITVATVRTPRKAAGLIITMLLAGVAEALVGIWQYINAAGPFAIGEAVRAYGTIGKPNTFAGFLGMSWPLGVALGLGLLWLWWRNQRQVGLLLAALGAGGAGLIILAGVGVSFSRGAWVGALVSLVVMAALAWRRRALPWLIVGGLLAALVISVPNVLPTAIAERATSITENLRIFDAGRVTVTDDNFAIVERMAHWQAGARMFLAHPVLGVGPDNFNRAYPEFFVGQWSISQGHAHNYYIHIAAEAGLIGLLSYLLLIGAVSWMGWRAVRATRGTVWAIVAIGGCGIIAAIQAHNVFENLHVLNFGIQLSAVWGLLTVLVQENGWQS